MSVELITTIILFLAVFMQSFSGFGAALVAMALLPAVISIHTITPLVALVIGVMEILLLIRYREALNLKAIWPIIVGALLGIPLGIFFLSRLDEEIVLKILGVVISGYAFYALFPIRLPCLEHPLWAYLAGFLGGLLGGAYNTSGPPVIVYGSCRNWDRDEFKSNVQLFFMVVSVFTISGHILSGNLTAEVWRYFLYSIPATILGVIVGVSTDRYVNPAMFRKVVTVLLLVMGVRLILA